MGHLDMTFSEAQALLPELQILIDCRFRSMDIDEVIIAPAAPRDFALFSDDYQQTLDANFSLQPYQDKEVKLVAVMDRFRIREYGFFYHVDVEELRRDPKFDWPG